jgi:hypothetical protein
MSRKHEKGRLAPFVPLDKEMMDCPAWRAMSHGARLLYLSLKRRWRFKQRNNGRIFMSQREAQNEMRGHRDSISRWYRELQHYGFIVMTDPGGLGVDGKGRAPNWRLTEIECFGGPGGNTLMLPTKNYLKWNGQEFKDERGAVKRERDRKQNPGPQIRARVARKLGPLPARKLEPVRLKSGPQTRAIGNGHPGPQTRAILSIPLHGPSDDEAFATEDDRA